MERDEVFNRQQDKAADFRFGSKVAGVFDDMVNRSVPFYDEIQRMVSELAAEHSKAGTRVYDLGCSIGTTMLFVDQTVAPDIGFVGIDDSRAMLDKCRQKLEGIQTKRNFELVLGDLTQTIEMKNASVAV